jgi:transforming growth factor-beta-induced protein
MKNKSTIATIPALSIALCMSHLTSTSAADRSISEFSGDERSDLRWGIVNDGVMGGLSKGKVSFTDEGTMRFAGKLSLKNNGGFSTARTGKVKLDFGDSDGLAMRVKGDGRTYQLRASTDAKYRFMEISFKAEFTTVKGEWTEVKVPFADFKGSFRGRELPKEVFDPSKIQRLGLLLADKKEGAFEVELDWIRAYGETSSPPASGAAKSLVDTAVADGRFKTLAAALGEADLLETIRGAEALTVFAPTDKAFAKLPKGTVENLLKPENKEMLQAILKYHALAGSVGVADALKAGAAETLQGDTVSIGFADGRVRINDATLVQADIECSNGVIHVIDSVLLPPKSAEPEKTTVISVANSAGSFKTLLAAVEAAGLTETLTGEGPFTVLAPTDKAFAALPKGAVADLLKKENLGKLKAILTHHVVAGKISAGDALNAKKANSLNGSALNFSIKDGQFQVNGATVVSADIDGENGVIHVIDTVLLPPSSACKSGTKKECSPSANQSVSLLEVMETAIDKGVPLFNGGDAKGCADIYAACLVEVAADERCREDIRRIASAVVKQGEHIDNAEARAWLYRRAIVGALRHFERKG